MRESALERFGNTREFLIGVNGSYARREATEESDVDFFFLTTGSEPSSADESQAEFRNRLEEDLNLNPPASGGVDVALRVGRVGDRRGLRSILGGEVGEPADTLGKVANRSHSVRGPREGRTRA